MLEEQRKCQCGTSMGKHPHSSNSKENYFCDRIEELEKNLSYEVEQKIKLADTLRDERAKTQEMKDYGDRAVHKLNQARFDLRDERAKRPDREQLEAAIKRGLQAYYDHKPTGEDDPTEPEHLIVEAVLSSLEGGRNV